MTDTPRPAPNTLLRELGPAQATSIVVGVVIGSGIFLVPAEMMQAAGSARLVYLAWIVGGIFSFFGALTYAELGAMKPQAGGEYVYIRDAYGPLPGFLCGWTWTVVVKPSSLAAIAIGIVRILANFPQLGFLAVHIGQSPFTWGQIAAIAFLLFISAINYIGIRRAGNFQLAFTLLKIILIVGIAALAFSTHGDWGHFTQRYPAAPGGIVGFAASITAALWAYDGWSDLNMVAEEIRAPERNIPLAMIGGMFMIGALYMLVNAAVQYALLPDRKVFPVNRRMLLVQMTKQALRNNVQQFIDFRFIIDHIVKQKILPQRGLFINSHDRFEIRMMPSPGHLTVYPT